MIRDYVRDRRLPDLIPEGDPHFPGHNEMLRQTRNKFIQNMRAFRWDAEQEDVVLHDYDNHPTEKAKM